ncbi:MAG: flagellar basal body-associated FliL family protein [Oscillospiraceae bacterium]|jgi:flagellar FliL protein|nr:flagellar basal body-associated FliL family protein [Oscillospiraceae bacterium]
MKKALPIIVIAVVVIVVGVVVYTMFFSAAEKPVVYDYYTPGDFFVTNVNDSGRLFKSSIVLVLNSNKLQDELKVKNTLIRDTILFILREKNEAFIKDLRGQDILRTDIANALNERLGIDNVVDILFNDYVMQ